MTTKKTRRTFSKEYKLDVIQQSYRCENIGGLAPELDRRPELAQRVGQPSVVDELLAGILLGTSLLNGLFPGNRPVFARPFGSQCLTLPSND